MQSERKLPKTSLLENQPLLKNLTTCFTNATPGKKSDPSLEPTTLTIHTTSLKEFKVSISKKAEDGMSIKTNLIWMVINQGMYLFLIPKR
jgi:hypothetical protein